MLFLFAKWQRMELNSKWLIAFALILVFACSAVFVRYEYQANAGTSPDRDTVFQFAAFNTFSTGKYTGVILYSELKQHGDFGIGTFDGLNGEMLAIDGIFYQIPSSGIPKEVESNQTSPFATVTYFEANKTFTVSGVNYTELKTYLDSQLGSSLDVIYAIKISGTYDYVQARSPEKQVEPYLSLSDALKTQAIFNFSDISATAVGFWFPGSMNGIDPAGYHLHIITDDRTAGGHLLECIIDNAIVEVDVIKRYSLVLP